MSAALPAATALFSSAAAWDAASLLPGPSHLCSLSSAGVALQGGDVRRAAGSGVGLSLPAGLLVQVLGCLSSVVRNQAARPLPLARWIPLPPSLARKPPAKVQAPSPPLSPGSCLYCAGLDPFLTVPLGLGFYPVALLNDSWSLAPIPWYSVLRTWTLESDWI